VSNLYQAYDSANVGIGKTLRVQPGYVVAEGNAGANYQITLVDSLGDVLSGSDSTQVNASNPLPQIIQTQIPRFPGAIDIKPITFDLPMPPARGRRGSWLDPNEDEQTADVLEPAAKSQNPS
jgi:hypothetical protein